MALRILLLNALFAVGITLEYNLSTPKIEVSLNLTDPQDVFVEKGQEAVLKCQAESLDGKIQTTWQHNNKTILTNSTKWEIRENGDLHIPKVFGKKANEITGEYRCLVRNQAGSLLSNVAKLSLISMEKEFSRNPKNSTVYESQPVILQCGIHSSPPADIQFEFNDTTSLPQDTRYVPLSNGTLLIQNSQISDSGIYRCRARNDILDKVKYSKIAVLNVLPNPNEIVPPSFLPLDVIDYIAKLGEKISLHCAVTGWPKPTVQWIRDDKIVSNWTTLEIAATETRHDGVYTCRAFNEAGQISRAHRLEVQRKPFFEVTPASKSYLSGMTVRMTCIAGGLPEPTVTWLRDGVPLRYGARVRLHNMTLMFSHTFSTDSGIYQCIATNSAGTNWTAAQIKVPEPSSPPHGLTCRPLDSHKICLSWLPPIDGNARYYTVHSFHTVNGIEKASPEYVTSLTYQEANDLKSNTTYMFYVRSYFNKTVSDPIETVTCTTGVVGDRNLHVKQLGEDSVILEWSEISSDETCTNLKKSYEIQWKTMSSNILNGKTDNRSFVVTGLLPGTKYLFKVSSSDAAEKGSWIAYTMSNISISTSQESNGSESLPAQPQGMTYSNISAYSVTLKWTPLHKNVKFYTACYTKASQFFKCDQKSFTNSIEVNRLSPNTEYQFKIRAHNFEGVEGPFSEILTVRTPSDVPSKIDNIKYTLINESTVWLHWQAPSNNGEKLIHYNISYTPNINWPFSNWSYVTVPALNDSVSTFLGNLQSGAHYYVLVRAVSKIGPGKINTPLEFSMTVSTADKIRYHKKVGFIIGTLIALLCIICCAFCILMRRRCVRRRAMAEQTAAEEAFGYPAVAHYASAMGSVQVRLQEPCAVEARESERLMAEGASARGPTVSHRMDSKGSDKVKNGYSSGLRIPLMEDFIRMRDNPQFNGNGCKSPKPPGSSFTSRFIHDSNSNVKPSRYHRCDFQSARDDSFCDDVHSSGSSRETSFNTTQETVLDEFSKSSTNKHRRKTLLVGPNG